MGKDDGLCPQCGAVNSYTTRVCVQCRRELPWASWVVGRDDEGQPLGSARGEFSQRRGEGLTEGGGWLSHLDAGTGVKIFCVFAVLLAVYWAVGHFAKVSHQVARQTGANGLAASPANVVNEFKRANPAMGQDAAERRESR